MLFFSLIYNFHILFVCVYFVLHFFLHFIRMISLIFLKKKDRLIIFDIINSHFHTLSPFCWITGVALGPLWACERRRHTYNSLHQQVIPVCLYSFAPILYEHVTLLLTSSWKSSAFVSDLIFIMFNSFIVVIPDMPGTSYYSLL